MEYKSLSLDVHYGDCGPDGRIRPLSVLRIVQEAGLRHAHEMGITLIAAQAADALLFTTRMHMVFYHPLPRWQESIRIKTWVTEIKRVRAFRSYKMQDGEGRVAARAMLDGVLVDPLTHKPVRFDTGSHIPVLSEQTISHPEKIPPMEDLTFKGERHAEWYQTDGNGHINNIRHAEFALSALPEAYADRSIRDWTINYLGELCPSQCIRLYYRILDDGSVYTEGLDLTEESVFRSRIQFCPQTD